MKQQTFRSLIFAKQGDRNAYYLQFQQHMKQREAGKGEENCSTPCCRRLMFQSLALAHM